MKLFGFFEPRESLTVEKEEPSEQEMAAQVIEYATYGQNVARLNLCERGELSREVYDKDIKEYIRNKFFKGQNENEIKDKVESVYERFARFVWGYYILDDLIDDPDISDIRIIDAEHIYIKKKGIRSCADVSFKDAKDYERFVERVALKNKINIGNRNAIQVFTDTSLDAWIMRFNLSTKFVLAQSSPVIHIRKHSKHKKLLADLVKEKMLDEDTKQLLERKIKSGESFLVCGAGSAGKTTFMNAAIEAIPDKYSIFCVQESVELFTAHPREFTSYVTVENTGDDKVSYGLDTIARNGLLTDTDVYMIGEIKGVEARDFLQAAHNGAICYASVHAPSPRDAFIRLADNVKRVSDFSVHEIMYMLKNLKNIIFIKNYKINEMVEVSWNYEKDDIEYETYFKLED